MSDTNTNPHDAAIAAILARIAELDIQIAHHNQLARTDAAIRDELTDIVATLSRKPRSRKPRAVIETPAEDTPARPTVFASVPHSDTLGVRQPNEKVVPTPANDEGGELAGEAA